MNTSRTGMPDSQRGSGNQILPLENGDRLSRQEFERRYTAMPQCKKAELVEGVVYMASPLRFKSHAKPHARIITWLGLYQISTLGVKMGIDPTVPALLAGDMAKVLAVLQSGLNSPEHAEFVKRLSEQL